MPVLLRASTDPHKDVRFSIAQSLGTYNESVWEQEATYKEATQNALLRLMDDEDSDVRDWATFGIHSGNHNTSEAKAHLWKALYDSDPDVRGEAAFGLVEFGDTFFTSLLRELSCEEELMELYWEASSILGSSALLLDILHAVAEKRTPSNPPKPARKKSC